ncbi:MAG: DUF4258 domain-containing protein [Ardenticatenaceae bacterium]
MSRTYINGFPINETTFVTTDHAEQRMAQRNLSLEDVLFVLKYGKCYHRAGAMFFYLRGKDIPKMERKNKRLSQLEGSTVILSRDAPAILTVYRNRENGLRHIKRKAKYSQPFDLRQTNSKKFFQLHY